jgi:hypothetical protein
MRKHQTARACRQHNQTGIDMGTGDQWRDQACCGKTCNSRGSQADADKCCNDPGRQDGMQVQALHDISQMGRRAALCEYLFQGTGTSDDEQDQLNIFCCLSHGVHAGVQLFSPF